MLSNLLVFLTSTASAMYLSDFDMYYQNNVVLSGLIGQFEGNLTLVNNVAQNTGLTYLQMGTAMEPPATDLQTTYNAIEAIFTERDIAYLGSKFHLARREEYLNKYITEKNDAVKASYKTILDESNNYLVSIYAIANLTMSDKLCSTAHQKQYGLMGVYHGFGSLLVNKRDRAAQVWQLINYLKTH